MVLLFDVSLIVILSGLKPDLSQVLDFAKPKAFILVAVGQTLTKQYHNYSLNNTVLCFR